MTDDYKSEIRDRMGGGELQQTVSSGLFGIADADVFTALVRETYPQATVGGVTNDQLEGALLRVGTGETRVFKSEIEALLDRLGEERVTQTAWGVEAKRWSDEGDKQAPGVGQTVTVRVDGVQRLLNDLGDDFLAVLRDQMFEEAWPPGSTSKFSESDVESVNVEPVAGEIVYEMAGASVDSDAIRALESFPRKAIWSIASVDDPLGLPEDQRIEMEKASADYGVREVEVEIRE